MAQKRPNRQMRMRVRFLILLIVVAGFVLVAGRLFYLQVINSLRSIREKPIRTRPRI